MVYMFYYGDNVVVVSINYSAQPHSGVNQSYTWLSFFFLVGVFSTDHRNVKIICAVFTDSHKEEIAHL